MLVVTFRVAGAAYAIRCDSVVAVIPQVELRPVAQAPASLKGMFAYRGELTPVVDVCRLLSDYACPTRLSSRIAIVRCRLPAGETRLVGLLAEHMTEARQLSGELRPARPVSAVPYFAELWLDGGEPLQFLNVDAILPSSATTSAFAPASALPRITAGEADREPAKP